MKLEETTPFFAIISVTFAAFCICMLCSCGTATRTKTTEYNADGTVSKIVETTSDASDFAALVASADGAATTLSADVSKFSLGWNGYGLNWLSVSGVRVKAPVKNSSDSAAALEKTAQVISSTKTTITADGLGVNTAPKPSSAAPTQE